MRGNYDQTHKQILKSGLKMFSEYGYEKTDLRSLCKDAGVTTGAFYKHFKDKENLFTELVSPVINAINKMYDNAGDDFFENLSDEEKYNNYNFSEENINFVVDYIYKNFDIFKLLLLGAEGTKFNDFIEYLTKKEDDSSFKAIEFMNKNGRNIDISKKEMHMLNRAYWSCVAEVVLHDYLKSEAVQYIARINKFFSVGWAETILKK